MGRTAIAALLLVGSLVTAGCGSTRYSQHSRERSSDEDTLALMTKEDIVKLSQAGVSDSLIISQMRASRSYFQLSTQDIIDLVKAGVSERVIDAMIRSEEASQYAERRGRYYYYPPYYWYGGYPFIYSRYYPVYFGFSTVYHRPFFGHRAFFGSRGYGRHR